MIINESFIDLLKYSRIDGIDFESCGIDFESLIVLFGIIFRSLTQFESPNQNWCDSLRCVGSYLPLIHKRLSIARRTSKYHQIHTSKY